MKFTRLIESNTKTIEIVGKIDPSDIKEITLLSVEEAKRVPKNILATVEWWWLRDPGEYPNLAADVIFGGSIKSGGIDVERSYIAVRPALRIKNINSYKLKIGDIVECFGRTWYYVGDDLILSRGRIRKHCFNCDYNKPNANKFEGSDIQKYLQDWLKRKLNEYKK